MNRLVYNLQQRSGQRNVKVVLKLATKVESDGDIIDFNIIKTIPAIRLARSESGMQGQFLTPSTSGPGYGGDLNKVIETIIIDKSSIPALTRFTDSDLAKHGELTIVFNGKNGYCGRTSYTRSYFGGQWKITDGVSSWYCQTEYGDYVGDDTITLYVGSTLNKLTSFKDAISVELNDILVKVRKVLYDYESQGILMLEAEAQC